MLEHKELDNRELFRKMRNAAITLSGNLKLKIFGLLSCKSGKRMKKDHRVFFKDEAQARKCGYRPCGHCLPKLYKEWSYSIGK